MLHVLAIIGAVFSWAAGWTWYIVRPATPGWQRLGRAAPPLALCLAAPRVLFERDDSTGVLLSSFLLSWMLAFKLAAYCVGRGPTASAPAFGAFAACLCLPVNLRPRRASRRGSANASRDAGDDDWSGGADRRALALVKLALVLVIVRLVSSVDGRLVAGVRPLRPLVYGLLVYLFASFVMDASGCLVTALLPGLRLDATFDRPWLSASLAEFWARRWNLAVSAVLRYTVLALFPRTSSAWRALGVLACFLVSALVHEFMIWLCTGRVTGEWLAFFVLHGLLVLAENAITPRRTQPGQPGRWRRRDKSKTGDDAASNSNSSSGLLLLLLHAARVLITVAVVMLTAEWLFYPPITRYGVDQRVMQSLRLAV